MIDEDYDNKNVELASDKNKMKKQTLVKNNKKKRKLEDLSKTM